MHPIVLALLASFAVMAASLAGILFVFGAFGRFVERHLGSLVSFSAGVFLVIAVSLAVEGIEHAGPVGWLWMAAGAVFLTALFSFVPYFHHHHSDKEEGVGTHSRIDGRRILASDALHNAGDGILIAAAFAAGPALGWATVASVLIHEFLQEVSEFFVLRAAGYSLCRALTLNFAVSATILVGAVGGTLAIDTFEALEAPLLALSAGAFFVVVVRDLIPHSARATRVSGRYAANIALFLVGALTMYGVTSFVEHAHEGAADSHDEVVTELVAAIRP